MRVGPVFFVMCTGPDELKVVCESGWKKSYAYEMLGQWMGKGLLTNGGGAEWKVMRKILTRAFHFDVLKGFAPMFARNTKGLIAEWTAYAKAGQPVDVQMEMSYLSLDNIGEASFGVQFHAVKRRDSPFVKATMEASKGVLMRFLNPLYTNDFLWSISPAGRAFARALSVLHATRREAVERRRAELAAGAPPREKYFMDILLNHRDAATGRPLTEQQVADEVDTFMFEGHDTTSCGLMWTLYLVATHPAVEARVLEEVDCVYGDADELDAAGAARLEYLSLVIRESHRLYAPVPGVGRTARAGGCPIAGATIPEGTPVGMEILLMHRNPAVWTDPDLFDPSRFEQPAGDPDMAAAECPTDAVRAGPHRDASKHHAFAYIPFSAGPRNCIGQNFALLEEKIVLSMIWRHFRLEYVEGQTIKPYGEMVLRNEGPIMMRLHSRRPVA